MYDHKILVVDDAAVMRMLLRKILTKNGFNNIEEACDVEDAVEKFKTFKPDVVTLDITMPSQFQDKDGINSLKDIMTLDPKAKVIMCSARGQKEKVKEAILSGAKDFIVKPFEETRVIGSLKKVLGL